MSVSRDLRRLKALGASWFGGSAAYVPLTSNELDDRFNTAIVASVIVHMLLVFGLTFKAANPELFQTAQPLEVVLVNARSLTQPLDPEALAQHSLDGGGDVEEDRQAKSPLPASERDAPSSTEQLDNQIKNLEAMTRQLMVQAKADYAIRQQQAELPVAQKYNTPAPVSLAESSLEQFRLIAQINREIDTYQKRPHRAIVGARTQEISYARYIEDWRLKIERIGNLNYPEAARRNGIYGYLKLEVCIEPSGRLYDPPPGETNPTIVQRSNSRVLDAAAVKIVEMSAPFGAFPPEMREAMRKEHKEILCVIRTWSFTREDQLTSSSGSGDK
jgi:protein TonB